MKVTTGLLVMVVVAAPTLLARADSPATPAVAPATQPAPDAAPTTQGSQGAGGSFFPILKTTDLTPEVFVQPSECAGKTPPLDSPATQITSSPEPASEVLPTTQPFLVLKNPNLTPEAFISSTGDADKASGAGVDNRTTQPSSQPTSPEPASQELLQHLQQQLKSVDTVQADFVQEKQLSVLNHKVTITGNFAMQKPNKLVWIVRDPVKYAIRIDGEEIRQWDEDTNQVQVIHLGGDPTFAAVTQQLQAWFMGDYKTLGDSYDVELQGENPLRLGFIPKGQSMVAKVLKQVDLTFGKSEQSIDKMVVSEASGDVTTLQFNSSRINQPIPKATWEIPPHER